MKNIKLINKDYCTDGSILAWNRRREKSGVRDITFINSLTDADDYFIDSFRNDPGFTHLSKFHSDVIEAMPWILKHRRTIAERLLKEEKSMLEGLYFLFSDEVKRYIDMGNEQRLIKFKLMIAELSFASSPWMFEHMPDICMSDLYYYFLMPGASTPIHRYIYEALSDHDLAKKLVGHKSHAIADMFSQVSEKNINVCNNLCYICEYVDLTEDMILDIYELGSKYNLGACFHPFSYEEEYNRKIAELLSVNTWCKLIKENIVRLNRNEFSNFLNDTTSMIVQHYKDDIPLPDDLPNQLIPLHNTLVNSIRSAVAGDIAGHEIDLKDYCDVFTQSHGIQSYRVRDASVLKYLGVFFHNCVNSEIYHRSLMLGTSELFVLTNSLKSTVRIPDGKHRGHDGLLINEGDYSLLEVSVNMDTHLLKIAQNRGYNNLEAEEPFIQAGEDVLADIRKIRSIPS